MAAPTFQSWTESFRSPPVAFRPLAFWSWNEILEAAEIRRQMDLLAEGGFGGAFLHSRPGLITPYMQDDWMAAVEAAIDQARRRGLHVWLYDEDGWPSGVAGGAVPSAGPEHRIKALCARPVGHNAPPGAVPIGAASGGLQVYAWTAPLGDTRYRGLSYADMLSRATVRKFIDEAYEPYHQRFGDHYGSLIKGEFFDEPRVVEHFGLLPGGPVAFSTDLIQHFIELHGYDPTDRLSLLFDDGAGAAKLRLHYFRTTSDLYERNFALQVSDWCRDRGIALTGHFMSEESVFAQQLMGVKIMPAARHLQVPGIDHLARQVDEVLTAKQVQSIVNQYGHPRMLSELYGAGGYDTTFEDRLWIAHQQLCFGVNLFVPHLALYTMTGGRKADCPPNLFYQQPWWPIDQSLEARLSRLSVALSQGQYVADALVLHPQESAFVLWKANTDFTPPDALLRRMESLAVTEACRHDVIELDQQLKSVMNVLLSSQRTFDLGDEQILADIGKVERREDATPLLRVGKMTYELIILPSLVTIRPSTLRLLREFASAGGVVLRCGQAPSLLDGDPSQPLDRWVGDLPRIDLRRLRYVLDDVAPANVRFEGSGDAQRVYTHVRDLGDSQRLVFVTNLSRFNEVTGELIVSGGWKSARVLDQATGVANPLACHRVDGGLSVGCSLAPTEARLILLSTDRTAAPTTLAVPARVDPIEVTDWSVERLDLNALPLDVLQYRVGDGAWSARMPVAAAVQELRASEVVGGQVTFRYGFKTAGLSVGRLLRIVVERASRFSIHINGRHVAYAGLPFVYDFRWLPIDVSNEVVPGANVIDVRCDTLTPADISELSTAYLFGDFSVQSEYGPARPPGPLWEERGLPLPKVTYLERDGMAITDPLPLRPGDVTVQGLPFYAGRLRLATRAPAGQWMLHLASLQAAVAQVRVDGRECAPIMQHPLATALHELAAESTVEVILYNTLRNLLGPHHHVLGEPDWVDPSTFAFSSPSAWCDSYAVLAFGDVERIRMESLSG